MEMRFTSLNVNSSGNLDIGKRLILFIPLFIPIKRALIIILEPRVWFESKKMNKNQRK